MLTASDAVSDRVTGLTLGADDYLGKPFAFAELVARVRALARRSTPARPPVLRARDPFTNAVRITISTLRRKLGEPPLIETVTGVGYRITP